MKTLITFAAIVAIVSCASPAGAEETQTGRVHYEFDLAAGKTLSLNVRSGDVRIEGSDSAKLTISFEGEKSDRATEVKVTYKDKGDTVECGIKGGPHNEFRILISVPRQLNLVVRMPAGAMEIAEVAGSKDIKMHAGDLDVDLVDADSYASIDASVTTGEIDVSALKAETGGFFRKFHRSGPGSFRLVAHVGAGQVTIH